jgi:hypothetical protein
MMMIEMNELSAVLEIGACLLGEFWGLNTDRILQPKPYIPHPFRHQMLTYLTSWALSDAQIQPISGHESKRG